MKVFASCLSVILTAGLLFFAGVFNLSSVNQSIPPTSTPIWATFPQSAATPYTTQAIYQPFQHGFMLWREDENCVYAIQNGTDGGSPFAVIPAAIPAEPDSMIHSYGYCLSVAPLTDTHVEATPPSGLIMPSGVLGKVWSYYPEIQTALGYATQPEQDYTATIPTNEGAAVMDGTPFTINQITLPDGSILACGSRAATAGTCSLITA